MSKPVHNALPTEECSPLHSQHPVWVRMLQRGGWVLLAGIILISLISISLWTGSVPFTSHELWQCVQQRCPSAMQDTVFWQIRVPRVLLAMVAGAGLALCGALLQSCTRNPLSDPYLFGIIAGAGLGVSLVTVGADWLAMDVQHFALPLAGFIGAMLAIGLGLTLSWRLGWQRLDVLVLSGVAVSFFLSAITSLLLYVADPFAANRVMFWLMGSLARADYQALQWITPMLLLTIGLMWACRRQLDALLLRDDSARSLGVAVTQLRIGLLLLCAALTAVIVAFCGGIAFVGLMIPHLVRRVTGPKTTGMLLGCSLAGAAFLLLVDTLARSLLPDQEIPIGIITSAFGSLFFMLFMFRRHTASA